MIEALKAYSEFVLGLWFSHNEPFENPVIPPEDLRSFFCMTTGLAGETGEVVEHCKKAVRDNVLDREALKKELGDLYYYLTRIILYFGFTPEEIMLANVEKLSSRRERGKLHGNGDNR